MMRRACPVLVLSLIALPGGARSQVFGPSGAELRVNTYTTGIQAGGAVALDEAGNFIVLWSGAGPDGTQEIYGQRFTFAAPVGGQFRLNTTTSSSQHGPAVASSGFGGVAAAWVGDNQDGDSTGIFGQRLTLGGSTSGGEFRVNTSTTGYQGEARVASDASGNFVVVWSAPDASGFSDVFAQRYAADGSAQGGEFRVNGYTTGIQDGPSVSRSASGFVVVWQSYEQDVVGSNSIYGQRYDSSGAALGTEFLVNAQFPAGAANPDVGMDSDGKFVVAWQAEIPSSHSDVFARRYGSGGAPLADAFRVNGYTTGVQGYPAVSAQSSNADPTGTFVVTWEGSALYGGLPGVFAQRYVGSGAPAGDGFRVNTTADGYVYNGGIDHDLSGNFVVTWTQGAFGSADVRLRRYCVNLAGDVNGDGSIDVSDIFYLINALFAGGPAPQRSGDANGDASTNVGDVFYLINYLFAGGPPPSCPIVLQ